MAQERSEKGTGKKQERGQLMTGAQAVIASLEAEGVELVFGYPGGRVVRIYDALYASERITHVTARHEQGAVHEADGYARATGKVGVVLVTSGPGAANTVAGIATAYMDSVPLIVITGQVPTTMIGTDAFQESDIMGISMPVVKHSFLLKDSFHNLDV
jgi:acetolactate synthase-1/2/3 large subunit